MSIHLNQIYNMLMAQHLVGQIHKFLIKNKKTVGVAESCTGGLLSSLLTQSPGSSRCFILGIVAYSNTAKETFLRVPHSVLVKNGAVSKIVATIMAQSVRKIARADFGIGITGIAGPSGGTFYKPLGSVFIAIDSQSKKICKKFHFTGNRSAIRKKAALEALELFKRML